MSKPKEPSTPEDPRDRWLADFERIKQREGADNSTILPSHDPDYVDHHHKEHVFPISEAKQRALYAHMAELGIFEDDIDEDFIKGGGRGGQKVNKSANCVQLHHRPTGAVVKCQKGRSLGLNRFFARRLLCDHVEAERNGGLTEAQKKEIEKIRAKKRRKAKRARSKHPKDTP